MEIDSIPDVYANKLRLSILAALASSQKNFTELKELTNATSGNLGAQLIKLEEWGYINCQKEFRNRKPQSTYQLTPFGLFDFTEYVELLERIIKR